MRQLVIKVLDGLRNLQTMLLRICELHANGRRDGRSLFMSVSGITLTRVAEVSTVVLNWLHRVTQYSTGSIVQCGRSIYKRLSHER